jgi:hypothetical protein
LRIDCQRYAEHQHPEQKKLHVRAFHKSYFSFFERVELSDPLNATGVQARSFWIAQLNLRLRALLRRRTDGANRR